MMTCTGIAFLFVSMTCTLATSPPADTYCQIAKPIYWSPGDSRKTKEQADVHNRVWKKLCQKAK
jgi:hypothetical protein